MVGAIVGDVIGSVYEGSNTKSPDFQPLFDPEALPTDDTVLTCAVAEWILRGAGDDLAIRLKSWFHLFPIAGFGGTFIRWAGSTSLSAYGSWGNGSAMRASPVGWAFDTIDDVLRHARRSAEVTHDHPEGIKGAEATAAAVFLARTGTAKAEIRAFIEDRFGYDLGRSLADIRPTYRFDVSCRGSVPEAIIAFLESTSFEDAVRKAVSLGGDSDTIACIAGGIAHAAYGVPNDIRAEVEVRLAPEMGAILSEFLVTYPAAG